MLKGTLMVLALVGLGACDMIEPFEVPAGDAGVTVGHDASAPTLPSCSAAKVYATGICGVRAYGTGVVRCSVGCVAIDGTAISDAACSTVGSHHFIHRAQNTTTNQSTWSDPDDAVIGPVVCVATQANCESVCH